MLQTAGYNGARTVVQSEIPQLQRHALWTLANFTRQETVRPLFHHTD